MLHADRQIWRDMTAMLEANDRIPERDFIKHWITQQAVAALAMGIRRQNDERSDVVSLARLLREIQSNPHVITRERFMSVCSPDNKNVRAVVDQNFDEWAGPGGSQIDPERVETRLDQLQTTVQKIVHHVNKKLAHTDEGDPPSGFTFDELDAAMKETGDLLIDLHLLLKCVALVSADPTIQVPWRRAFSVPWLPQADVERWNKIQEFIRRRREGGSA
jgi:hypothetical protein